MDVEGYLIFYIFKSPKEWELTCVAECLQIKKMKAIISGGLYDCCWDERELDINITLDIFLQSPLKYGPAEVFNKHKTRPMSSNEVLKANNS